MSADNYILISRCDGTYRVSDLSASAPDVPCGDPILHRGVFFLTLQEAEDYAATQYAEYGFRYCECVHFWRRKSTPVEVIRYHSGPKGNCAEVAAFLGGKIDEHHDCFPDEEWYVNSIDGKDMWAGSGEWIVKENGTYQVYSDRVFREKFEQA